MYNKIEMINENGNYTINFATDDKAEYNRIKQFITEDTQVVIQQEKKVGDVFKVKMKDGTFMDAMIMKFIGDTALFIMVDCVPGEYQMNDTDTNKGGYDSSKLRKTLNSDILSMFDDSVVANLVPFINGDLLRLPTEKEIFGENKIGTKELVETKQFEPMKSRRNRMAMNNNDELTWYWLFNKSKISASWFALVSADGLASSYGASASLGVRPLGKIDVSKI